MGPLGWKFIADLGLIVAGTGLAKIGKDRVMDDIYELKEQAVPPEENIFEVNDFEVHEF